MDSAITTKGQATIPKAIRRHLGVKPGDRIKFFVNPTGGVIILPIVPARTLRGMVKPAERSVTIDDMNEAIASSAAGRSTRRKRR